MSIQPYLASVSTSGPEEKIGPPERSWIRESFSGSTGLAALGGGSLVMWFGAWIYLDRGASLFQLSWFAYALAFLVNQPHFISSYQIFYQDQGHRLLSSRRHFLAGIFVPIMLLVLIVGSALSGERVIYSFVIHSMFVLVGWHYVKQVFGCVVASQAFKKQYLSSLERKFLLGHLYLVWTLNFFVSQAGVRDLSYYGFPYSGLGVPVILGDITVWLVAGSALLLVGAMLRAYLDRGFKVTLASVLVLLSLYTWYLPALHHPGFFYFVPFFHSLQYLVFVSIYRVVRSAQPGAPERIQRVRELVYKPILAIVMGGLAFYAIPKGLDFWNLRAGWWSVDAFGGEWAIAAASLFINIHHYFIDNVIWKAQVPEAREFFFEPIRNSS